MEGEFANASEIGSNLPNLTDLKNYLREEKPLYFQVLEQYLRNAANIINNLTAKFEMLHELLEREQEMERQRKNEERLALELIEQQQEGKDQEMMEPVPALEEEELAEWRQVPHEPSLNGGSVDVVPKAQGAVTECREVEEMREMAFQNRANPNSNATRPRGGTSESGGLPYAGSGRFAGTISRAAGCARNRSVHSD
ncbi:hypothetical protein LOAG_14402 [Loa loa]|uniref:ING domain-containing protein n=1 Tax=Loa loa TaxID=7209 RepID=A0A1I7VC51_LOALO|nr:hypothetical protein LOAG_14402 [Loa loa]EFO14122.2 hypothetical protein LOAG_14402 [Loa loa]